MAFFSFLGEVTASVLLGYLAFTNMIASHIERIVTPGLEQSPQAVSHRSEEQGDVPRNISPTFTPLGTVGESIPKILIENAEFQRAAIGAAAGVEDDVVLDPSLSLEAHITNALVNVFCQYTTDQYIRTTTGTGFFISHKGVLLTNAHVAQFLLLRDLTDSVRDVRCVIRTGNPATPRYEAELLYLPPAWITENAKLITDEAPQGTGERDYALLYIARSTDDTPLPARFPALPIDTALLPRSTSGIKVATAGYPAEALLREGARAQLSPQVASTTIGELYTFGSNFADIFAISDSPVGEHGASGGPVSRNTGEIIGLIVTKGDTQTEGEQSLRALSLSYIDRTILDETGYSLLANMRGDVAHRGKIFNSALAPFLTKLLSFELGASTSTPQ